MVLVAPSVAKMGKLIDALPDDVDLANTPCAEDPVLQRLVLTVMTHWHTRSVVVLWPEAPTTPSTSHAETEVEVFVDGGSGESHAAAWRI